MLPPKQLPSTKPFSQPVLACRSEEHGWKAMESTGRSSRAKNKTKTKIGRNKKNH